MGIWTALRRQTVNSEPATSFSLKQNIFYFDWEVQVDVIVHVAENNVPLLLFFFDVARLCVDDDNLKLKLLHPFSGMTVPISH